MTDEGERLEFIGNLIGACEDSIITARVSDLLKKHEAVEKKMQDDLKMLLQHRAWACKLAQVLGKFYLEDRQNEPFKDVIAKLHKLFNDNNIPWEVLSVLIIPQIENQKIKLDDKKVSANDNTDLRLDINDRLENIEGE